MENMRKRIAFKPHETRGQEIIKILENMGGVNKYNLDGSKGIIAIETNRGNYITNDWDYCGLLLNGWEIYTLEEYENIKKAAQDFAVDILTKERECYFDDSDVEIVAEAYMAGYKDAINIYVQVFIWVSVFRMSKYQEVYGKKLTNSKE